MGWEGSEISVPDCVLLLRSIIVEREPIYRQQESTSGFAAGLFGIDAAQAERLSDDRIGRALDRLFDADRAALLTEVVLCVAQRFGVRMQQLHNDSTSISLCGQYSGASGRSVRNRAILSMYSSRVWPRFISARMRSEPLCTGRCR